MSRKIFKIIKQILGLIELLQKIGGNSLFFDFLL